MTFPEMLELRRWITALTAESSQPWILDLDVSRAGSPLLVRVDPLACFRRGLGMRADQVVSIPELATLEEAKVLVADRLAERVLCSTR